MSYDNMMMSSNVINVIGITIRMACGLASQKDKDGITGPVWHTTVRRQIYTSSPPNDI
jgi:hypothetical protein